MNPELQRHLWLEFSRHRLLVMPGVLALILLAAAQRHGREGVAGTGLALFLALAVFWGSQRVMAALFEEWQQKTWDSQRMSALGPWQMTSGKLLGSTAFAWYGALLCLGVAALAWPWGRTYPLGTVIPFLLCAAVGVQAAALITSLTAARRGLARARAFGLIFVFLYGLYSVFGFGLKLPARELTWWDSAYSGLPFLLASTAFWAAATVLGAYRLMCQELQVRTTPWVWVAFNLCLAGYLAGFVPRPLGGTTIAAFSMAGLLVTAGLTYSMLFTEQTGALVLRRIWVRACRREWRGMLEETPCWVVSLALAAVFCVLAMLATSGRSPEIERLGIPFWPSLVLLFLLRDAAIFLAFALGRAPRRVEATTLFYLVLLYLILPSVFTAAGAYGLTFLVLPVSFTQPALTHAVLAHAVLAGHVVIALCLMLYRWRQSVGAVGLPEQGPAHSRA